MTPNFDFILPAGEIRGTATSTFTLQQVIDGIEAERTKENPDVEYLDALLAVRESLLLAQELEPSDQEKS